ncbi:hypothetical protein GW17_00000001 [Ensete ventricosum]|nr:hypothetical protein GW17_00000001 [Ensete ventricosum]
MHCMYHSVPGTVPYRDKLGMPIRTDTANLNCIVCDSGDIESMPFIEALRQLSFSVAYTGKYESQTVAVLSCSIYMHLQVANILNIHDVPNIWHIPLLLRVKIAMVGKYTGLTDSYLSVVKVCLKLLTAAISVIEISRSRHCGFSPVPFDIGMYRAVTVNFNHRHPLLGGFSLATTREEVGERGRTSDGAAL